MLKQWARFEQKLNRILSSIGRVFSRIFFPRPPHSPPPPKKPKRPPVEHPPLIPWASTKDKFHRGSEAIFKAAEQKLAMLEKAGKDIKEEGLATYLKKILHQILWQQKKILLATIGLIFLANGIYHYGQQIADNLEQDIFSDYTPLANPYRRPEYFRKSEKQFKVTGIILPIDLRRDHRKLVADLTFESSNKYIKAYFETHPYLIPDVLGRRIESVSINFPLEAEGKSILKEKIIEEVNLLLEELKIEGKIVNVYIDQLLGT